MSGEFVIASYKVQTGKEKEFESLLEKHWKVLSEQGMLGRPPYHMKTGDNVYLEVFEWRTAEEAGKAHTNPEVQKVWEAMGKIAEFVPLSQMKEANKPFAHFTALEVQTKTVEMSDYMMSAQDYKKQSAFYQAVANFKVVAETESFVSLQDPVSMQTICITNGPSIASPGASFQTKDLTETMKAIEQANGKIVRTWEYAQMRGANAVDPEGNALLLWSTK